MAKGKFSQPRNPVYDPGEADEILSGLSPELQAELSLDDVITDMESASCPMPVLDTTGMLPAMDIPEQEQTAEPEDTEFQEAPGEDPVPDSPVVRKNRKIALISLCVAVLVIVLGASITVAYLFGAIGDDGLILNNVHVAGVDLGGMTKEEAVKALHSATDLTYTNVDMVVTLPDAVITLTPANTGAVLDCEAAAQAAVDYGRTGTLSERRAAKQQVLTGEYNIALLSYLRLNTDYIYSQLEAYTSRYNSTYTPSSYSFDGNKPSLDGETFDVTVACQTLLLYTGTPEQYIDLTSLYNQVLDAYSFNVFEVDASGSLATQMPEAIDLEAIFEKYCSEPESATMDMTTMEIDRYETYGYTFSMDLAELLLSQAEYGETIGVPMQYVVPDTTAKSLKAMLFRDELSFAETKYSYNPNRTNNLELACAAINGYVLMPGDTFDYNDVVGERTVEAGYKSAPAYSGGQTVDTIGGGVCQVSSTLYYACLLADMEIVDRTNHSYISSYIDYGMDATVSWGGPEYVFRNNTPYPVRIEAWVADGYVRIRLVGTDVKDYYVVMTYRVTSVTDYETIYEDYPADNPKGYKDGDVIQTPYTGYTVRTYRCKYDKVTGELISEEEEAFSRYKSRDKIIARVASPEEPEDSGDAAE